MDELSRIFEMELFQNHKYKVKKGEAALRIMENMIECFDVGRLALSYNDNPYVIPLSHYYSDGCFYYHCGFDGLKSKILHKNSRACYLVDGAVTPKKRRVRYYHDPWMSLVCFGTVSELEDAEERLRVLKLYSEYYGGPPVKMDRAKTCNIIKFTVSKMRGRYGEFIPTENRVLLSWDYEDGDR